jgi:transposase InsO family protein
LNSHETLRAKRDFEALCRDFGVIPQSYLSDNGSAFTSQAFRSHLEAFCQIICFAGVGSHHHNGHAERSIQTIMSIARTMMLHSAIHWPDMADPCLWPMAVQQAVFLYNHTPSTETGLSPHDLFSKT